MRLNRPDPYEKDYYVSVRADNKVFKDKISFKIKGEAIY